MRMIKRLIFILTSLGFLNSYSQDFKTIDNSQICDASQVSGYIEPVDSFKAELTVTLDLEEFTVGKQTKEIDNIWSGTITDETPIIKITKNGAIRVSIARIIDNEKRYYVYRLHLYEKTDGCWEEKNFRKDWSSFKLGTVTHGYGLGTKGSSDYIGFSGKLIIE